MKIRKAICNNANLRVQIKGYVLEGVPHMTPVHEERLLLRAL